MTNESILERLYSALDKYESKYRHPDLEKLKRSGLYALFPEQGKPLAAMHWDQQWPHSDHAGVYLIFSKKGELFYVGKASLIGHRLSCYFQYAQPRGESDACRIVHHWKEPGPMYVVTVAVPDDSQFEACSLEEYLIKELNPSDNVRRLG
jgi:hypothetical protein